MHSKALISVLLLGLAPLAVVADEINYNRDIRPLLSNNCYACHGPDESKRAGGFRLDQQASAFAEADSGAHPIVAGEVGASELVRRINSTDPDEKMPPEDTNKKLSAEEIALITRWIEQGAKWSEHWSFVAPARPPLPTVKNRDWPASPLDDFILATLESKGLQPSAEAAKTTLIRRVTFDLTGLPPTLTEIDDFLADDSTMAYERVVDRLLKSPRYGEHMARYWLDAARYGDTHGLHLDNYREMWPYRDWVVQAFNDNMPYDRFTIEQLAGDLLPEATEDQQIASGFNRCHVTTAEGGSIAEEVYVRNVVDRVVTTGTVFMGLTLDCTRCHDHKYDPLTMKDFYSLFAFFNNLDGAPLDGNKKDPAPVIAVTTPAQKMEIARLESLIEEKQREIQQLVAQTSYVEPAAPPEVSAPQPQEFVWIEDAAPAGAKAEGGWKFVTAPAPVYSGEKASTRTASGLGQHFFSGAPTPLDVHEGDTLFAYVYLDPKNPPKQIMLQWNDGTWDHRAYWGGNHISWGVDNQASRRHLGELPETGKWIRLEVPAQLVGLPAGAKINGWAFTQFDGTTYWDRAGIVSLHGQSATYDSLLAWESDQRAAKGAGLPNELKNIIQSDPKQRTEAQQQQLRDYFIEHAYAETRDVFQPLHQQVDDARQQIAKLRKGTSTTLVFRERAQPKPAYVLHRGEYDQRREEVPRATPAVLPPLPDGAPLNRLGLAQWLVDDAHPLTARVAVNRMWQQVFGVGLVKTSEDFGSQGEPPSHPELLDWLAVDFRENGWDVKRFMKNLVMSRTYRQTSDVTPELLEVDPNNRLYARGPRFRLDAEMLRDQALAVSGLLETSMGGPSVKPPQPDGLWFAVGYSGSNTVRFKQDKGHDKVHRRTLYTFIKRTAPPPQMSTFDGPSRETCSMRRERTNTPLQALLLMNDPQYVEAARALAERVLREGGDALEDRVATMFRLGTARKPNADELAELVQLFEDAHHAFAANPDAAANLVKIGESVPDSALDTTEVAALTIAASTVLNLDEVIMKN